MPSPEVLVVGAGMAGLTAAHDLVASGRRVRVLEARERVGGRVWSPTLGNGSVVEMGGEWLSSGQEAVLAMARLLGLSLVDPGIDFVSRDAVGGEPIPEEEHRRVNRRLAELVAATDPERLQVMSASELIGEMEEDTPAFQVLRSRIEGTQAAPLETVAAAEIGADYGYGEQEYYRIEGGNDLLARELARNLDVDLGVEVTGVADGPGGVEVLASDLAVGAAAVILAVPLAILGRIDLQPGPPEPLRRAISELRMGTAAKAVVEVEPSPPLFRRQDRDIPAWYWTGLEADGSVRRAITGFAGTGPGVAALTDDPLSRLAAAVPESSIRATPRVVDWAADPLAGGCYSVIGPGQAPLVEGFLEPFGRVVLAGEHTNGSGSIDGAIRSGHRAAAIADRLVG